MGNVKDKEGAQADSLSVSASQSQSLSEEASKNASKHLSESESQSVSTSTSASVSASTSASESASTSASESDSTSDSQSQAGVTSELAKPATSETASNKETSVRKEDAASTTADAVLSKVITESLASLQAVENRLSQITSTTSSLVDTTTTVAVATTVTAENDKKAQEDRKRLSKISAEMGEYLAKSVGLPNTEAAVTKVNAAVTAIEEALKTPNADLTDVIKQATSARNSIINAVHRANNGQRSSLNGKAMERGANFRVAPGGAAENDPDRATYGFGTATVGYVVTKPDATNAASPANQNAKYGYREGTYLYATEGRQGNEREPSKANIATRVEVKNIAPQVHMKAERHGRITNWTVLFNDGGEPHDNPYFYFTVPKGHRITHMKVEQKDGGNKPWNTLGETDSDNAFRNNSKSGDLLPAIGNANNNQGGAYYENVAGVGPSGVGRGTLTSLRDFAFNNPDAYYQTDKITEKVKKEGDFAFESIEDATANVYALHPKGSARYEGYKITYTTESPENTKDYYMAGFRSLENSRHRNYLQMVGTQDRYRIELKSGKSSTFYKWGGVNNIGNLSGIADVYDKVTGQKVKEIPNGVTFKVDGTDVNSSVLNWLGNTRGAENGYGYLKFSKGNHKLTVTIPGDGGGTYELPFRIITQSDVYQPTINTNVLNQQIRKGGTVPNAASMISGFTNSSSSIPNLAAPDDMGSYKNELNGGPGGGDVIPPTRVSGTATSASNLNVKSVEWLGGGTTFGTGVGENMAVRATVGGKTVYLPLPSDIPASKLGKTLTDAERTKVLEHNGFTADTARIESGKVGLSKTLVVTYKDNENGDSQDTSEVFFENIAKATTPTAPAIQAPTDGSVTVTPQGESDSVTITYTPTTGNTNTTISVKKSGAKWDNPEPLPSGVTLNKDTGAVTISEPTVKDESQVTATAYNFNSEGATSTETAKMPYRTKSDRFYAVQGENPSQLTASDFITNSNGAAVPSTVTVTWKTRPDFSSNGEKTAVLTVTSSGITKDFNYPYTVYKKVEAKNPIGGKGQFYAFKADDGKDTVTGGSYANNIGGNTDLYTNIKELPENTKWSYRYKLNNQGTATTTAVGTPSFSSVWHTTGTDAKTHHTTYTLTATYPNGRFGTVSSTNPALTSETSFDYTVVDPVEKQTYETTVGDTAPLNDIITSPGNALKNSNASVTIPTGTTYAWQSTPDASAAGIYKKEVSVTLPQGSAGSTNSRNVPVTIKVKPQAPQIADNQLTNTGGLPNRGITVTNVTPGATVTLTLGSGSKTVMKTVPANATSLTIGASDLADSNGLLPVGDVTVKQSKGFTNPTTNRTETLESATTTKTITKETERPTIEYKFQIKDSSNNWVDAPKKVVRKGKAEGYEIFAGDEYRVIATAKDNSGKLKDFKVLDDRQRQSNFLDTGFATGGATGNIEGRVTTATDTNPAKLEIFW